MSSDEGKVNLSVRHVAVVDIGTSSIRMAVAEINPAGEVRTLETLSQGVSLGKDTFTRGEIAKTTIEECVRVLKSYRAKLEEYAIERPSDIRIVATSAVREATNRMAFLDRIYIATAFDVDPLDAAEVHRITYRSIQPQLAASERLQDAHAFITEVGGGSTELLLVESGHVSYSHSFRLGSLRLREQLTEYRGAKHKRREIMEGQIRRTLEQLPNQIDLRGQAEMLALGGDMRFVARELSRNWDPRELAEIAVHDLEKLASRVLRSTEEELVRKYRISIPEAETLGPALLVYLELANILSLQRIHVSHANLRDGLMQEMVAADIWTADFRTQIINSAIDLGRKYAFDEAHARHVAELGQQLFDALAEEHRLDERYGLILFLAALLHEVGAYVNTSSLHKHSMYLILNSDLFGITPDDALLVGLVARYHRRASPKATHQGFATLDRDRRVAVSKLAALLRLADALATSRDRRVRKITCTTEPGRLILRVPDLDDVSMEQLAVRQAGLLFEQIFGMRVAVQASQASGR